MQESQANFREIEARSASKLVSYIVLSGQERHAALHVSITLSSLILRFLELDQRDHAEVGIVRQQVRCESCPGPSY